MEKRLMMFLAALFLCVGGALAQTKVSGTVVSQDDGQPVIGATVLVVGTQVGTVTNANGQFSLTCPAGKNMLRITYVGMEPLEVSARANMRIMLTSDQRALDEVIVVAYGTQKKSAFTGSAAVINSDEIGKVQVTNAVDALKGKASGVQINTASGQPGSTPTVRIRGINSINAGNSPLYVVDGSPFDGDLNTINPIDIESMTVLKDAASTSLYGARGGNGVILITTKSAKKGRDATITFDAKWGSNQRATPDYEMISSPAKYYEMWYKGLYNYAQDTWGYDNNQAWSWANNNLTAYNDYGLSYNVYTIPEGQAMIGQNGKLNPFATLGRVYTYNGEEFMLMPDNWMNETYHNSMRQEYTVSATGSTDRSNFYLSANYLKNEGITDASDYTRFTGRLKADYQLKPWLKAGANINYAHYEQNSLDDDGESGSSGNAFALLTIAPIYPMYIRDGQGNIRYNENAHIHEYDYGDATINGMYRPYLSQANPVSANKLDTHNTLGNTFSGTGLLEARLPFGFTLTSINTFYVDEYRGTDVTNGFFGPYASSKGSVSKSHGRVWSTNFQQRLNWHKTFNIHDIEAMVAHEYYKQKTYSLSAYKTNMFSPDNKELRGAVIMGSADSYDGEYNDERWIGRAQYNYDEKYFVHGSVTREASSRFHPDHRWGTFWSFGAGWLMNKESFLKDVKWIDELKLKASYGENGNDAIGSYQYVSYYDIVNSNDNVSLTPSSLGNEEISWEKATKFNAGIDFSLFNGRLSGNFEYYRNKTNDMLSWFPLPPSFGFTGYYANIGNVVNHGFELSLNGDIIRTKDLTWSVYANITTQKNKIDYLPEERKTMEVDGVRGYSSGNYFYGEGEPIYTYRLYKYAGVDKTTGKALYYYNEYERNDDGTAKTDADGNKIYTGELGTTDVATNGDYYLCGTALPDAFGGFGTSLAYKGFDLSFDFTYQLGGKVYDSTYAELMSLDRGDGMHVDMLNAWTAENPNSDVPRIQFNDKYTAYTSDRFLTSASYLSLQNITIGYTLPKKYTLGFGVQNIRVYGVADNIWVWSKRQGLDPRQSISGANTGSYYAPIRTISGGITVTF